MQALYYPHFPSALSTVHIALFTDVSNAASLRARIIAASTREGADGVAEREAVSFAFVDAKLVTSLLHIQTAIYQSLLAAAQEALLTKTVHSEIIWYLNPNHNITEALRRFGVSDQCKDLLVIRIGPPHVQQSEIEQQMKNVVAGELSPMEKLRGVTDWGLVKKYYKLNADTAVSSLSENLVQQRGVMDEIVSSFVAMKSVAS